MISFSRDFFEIALAKRNNIFDFRSIFAFAVMKETELMFGVMSIYLGFDYPQNQISQGFSSFRKYNWFGILAGYQR